MKHDVKVGLLLALIMGLALAPRFIPDDALSSLVGTLKTNAGAEDPEDPEPNLLANHKPVELPSDAPIVVETPAQADDFPGLPSMESDALTDVFPDGFPDGQAKSQDQADDGVALPPLDDDFSAGQPFLIKDESSSDEDMPNFLIDGPPSHGNDDNSIDGDVVTEFVPYTETIQEPFSKETDDEVDLRPGGLPALPGAPEETRNSSRRESEHPIDVQSFAVTVDDLAAKSKAIPSPKSRRKGPIHPYFQRYLERGTYYVRPGETLASIAWRLYQDKSMADDLYRANGALLRTPTDVRAGMQLKLP